jgi:hypothetical protein
MKPLRLLALTLTCAILPSFAQQVISAKSGLLSYVEGDVTLNGEPVDFSGVHFSDVKENAVVRTADGRAEVLLTPGVVLRMGENTSLRMITNRLVDTRLELLTGSAVVEADQIAKDTSVTIVCKDGVVTLPKAGLYRFDMEPAQFKVFKGEADVEFAGNTQVVSGGHMVGLSNGATTLAKFDVEDTDTLDRWSHRRGSFLAMANASAANSLVSSGGSGGYGWGGFGMGGYGLGAYGMNGWGMQGCSSAWAYNMYYNMMTYMPCYGSLWSPYGYRFWSPYTIYRYNGFAPPIYGGGAGRTGVSTSGSAALARPVATASNRSNSPAVGLGTSRGTFSNAGGAGRVGGTTSAITSGSGGGGGFSGGGGGGGGFSGGGGHAGGAGGGGGHAGGGGHR